MYYALNSSVPILYAEFIASEISLGKRDESGFDMDRGNQKHLAYFHYYILNFFWGGCATF